MTDLPESFFANPVWHALKTKHRRLALTAGEACRYPADVAPFAALATSSATALEELHSLLVPGESLWLLGETHPRDTELSFGETLECLQMALPKEVAPPNPPPDPAPDRALEIVPLSGVNAAEMFALTNIAFPGLFRARTCEMGAYYGVRCAGTLIAMAGERFLVDGYSEISGVCTHPAHRGHGYATSLIWELVRKHRREGSVSWLHVALRNQHAREIYLRLGFTAVRKVTLHRISRKD